MCAIPQLVSAPLNPIPIVEHFRPEEPPTTWAQLPTRYVSRKTTKETIIMLKWRTKYTRQVIKEKKARAYLNNARIQPTLTERVIKG